MSIKLLDLIESKYTFNYFIQTDLFFEELATLFIITGEDKKSDCREVV